MVSAALVSPVREIVKEPGLLPGSEARGSVACTDTKGGLGQGIIGAASTREIPPANATAKPHFQLRRLFNIVQQFLPRFLPKVKPASHVFRSLDTNNREVFRPLLWGTRKGKCSG